MLQVLWFNAEKLAQKTGVTNQRKRSDSHELEIRSGD